MAIYNKRPLIYIPRKKKKIATSPTPTPPEPFSVEAVAYGNYQLRQYNGNISSRNALRTFSIEPEAAPYNFSLQDKSVTWFRVTANNYGYGALLIDYELNNFTNTLFDRCANGLRWANVAGKDFGYTCYGFFVPSNNTGLGGKKIFRFKNFPTGVSSHPYHLPITPVSYNVADVQGSVTYNWTIKKLECRDDVLHILANKLIDMGLIDSSTRKTGCLMLISSNADDYRWRAPVVPSTTYLNADFLGLANNAWGHNQFGQKNQIEDIDLSI